jgi:drug/metabolite transporter (DMT)-like permease
MTPTPVSGELAAVGVAFFWMLSSVAWAVAGKSVGSTAVCFLRMVFVLGMFTIFGLATGRAWLPLDADAKTWGFLLLSGFLGFFMGDMCIFKAFLLSGVRLSMLIGCFTPIVSQAFAYLIFGEKITLHQSLGILITLGGVLWVVLEKNEQTAGANSSSSYWKGICLALVSTIFFALSYVLIDFADKGYDPIKQAIIRIFGSCLGFLVFLTIGRRWSSIAWAIRQRFAMSVVAMGALVGPGIGAVMLIYAKQHGSTGAVVAIIAAQPVMILPFSIYLFKEKISLRGWLGAIISVVGVAVLLLR